MAVKKVVDSERLDGAMTATADAIREKTSGTEPIPWNTDTGFAEAVAGITGGSAAVSVPMKDVNFYDYDGTRLYSYTVKEAAVLSELPPLPTQDGLICQGWNWTLADIKATGKPVDVGAMYITDDGKTRIYITLPEGRTSPMLGCAVNGDVVIDWGDGTAPDTLTGTSVTAAKWTPNHNYTQPGDYVITLTVNGQASLIGKSSGAEYLDYHGFLRHSAENSPLDYVYLNAVNKIELGNNIVRTGTASFANCYMLRSITIPEGVTLLGTYAFLYCVNLRCVVLPRGLTRTATESFTYCSALETVVMPFGITSIRDGSFLYCYSLIAARIPDTVEEVGEFIFAYCRSLPEIVLSESMYSTGFGTFEGCLNLVGVIIPKNISTIEAQSFNGCYSVRYYDFTSHTSIPMLSAVNAFDGIADDCEIRVPAALADAWKAATNWATYADYIVGV